MNKKLLALAVAVTPAAPAAVLADATVYGKLNVAIDYVDQDNFFDGWGLSGNQSTRPWTRRWTSLDNNGPASRFGLKGSEDLGNGIKAIYQVEFGIDLTDTKNSATKGDETLSMRNSYVGLASALGTIMAGRHDTPLKISTGPLDLFSDTMADYNNTVGFNDLRVDNAIAYISPSLQGFTFAGAVHAGGGAMLGPTPEAPDGYNPDADSLAEGYSLATIYRNGPLYGSLAYESLSVNLNNTEADRIADADKPYSYDDWNKWRLGIGILDWKGFTLTGIYENWDNAAFYKSEEGDLWQVQAGYAFGNYMVKAMVGRGEWDWKVGGSVWETWSLGADYNFSNRTKVFALYTNSDADKQPTTANGVTCGQAKDCSIDWSGYQLGLMHSF